MSTMSRHICEISHQTIGSLHFLGLVHWAELFERRLWPAQGSCVWCTYSIFSQIRNALLPDVHHSDLRTGLGFAAKFFLQ